MTAHDFMGCSVSCRTAQMARQHSIDTGSAVRPPRGYVTFKHWCQNILGYSCKGRFNTLFERCIWGEAGAVLRLESNFLPLAWSYFLHSIETYQYDSLL